MLKMSITYTDFNGNTRTEEHHFHLTQHEITKLQMSVKGGLIASLKEAIRVEDGPTVMEAFEKLIDMSYGIKMEDGKTFKKTPEILEAFKSTPAYSELFIDLLTKPEVADKFTRGVLPVDVAAKLPKDLNEALPDDMKGIIPETN